MKAKLPVDFGYVIRKEPKAIRRTFAMRKSLVDALETIAEEGGTNINALVHNVLEDFVVGYFEEAE